MDETIFSKLVAEAIDNIPEPYHDKVAGVRFKVEQEPTPKQRKELGMRRCDALFGLYEGVPLPSRGGTIHSIVPDTITIFMYPMIHLFTTEIDLKKQINNTVWHEVAHYFGLDHERIHLLENKK